MEAPHDPPPPPDRSLSNQDVDSILSASGRRQRIRKACYPCNKRKIKCDRDERTPCSNCAKRPHPELCTFDDHAPRSSHPRPRPSSSSRPTSHAQSPAMPHPVGYPSTPGTLLPGIHSASAAYNQTPYTNGSSHEYQAWSRPSMDGSMGTPNSGAHQGYNYVGSSAPPATRPAAEYFPRSHNSYGNQPPTTSVYARSSGATGIWEQVAPLLPPHKHVLKYFEIYRTLCNPLYPVIPDPDDFEAEVCMYLEDPGAHRLRAEIESLAGNALERRLSWFSLVCATTATGVQFSDLRHVDRKALVQEYFRNAMQLLQLSNYMFGPTESSVMTLLLLCRILQNEFEPEASWSLLGTVIRLAEMIGLATPALNMNADLKTRETQANRQRKIWWAIIWQESYLTMCFGKPSTIEARDPPSSTSSTNLSYIDCMYTLCTHAISARHPSRLPKEQESFKVAIETITFVHQLHEHALPRLADKSHCRSIQDRMEYFSFRIHQGFTVSFLSQLLLKASKHHSSYEQYRKSLQTICRASAIDCIQAYIDMNGLSEVPRRTWSLAFNAVSSAISLGALPELGDAERAANLQRRLLDVLARSEDETEHPTWPERYPNALAEIHDLSVGGRQVKNGDTEMLDDNETTKNVDRLLNPPAMWSALFSTSSLPEGGSGAGGRMSQQYLFGI